MFLFLSIRQQQLKLGAHSMAMSYKWFISIASSKSMPIREPVTSHRRGDQRLRPATFHTASQSQYAFLNWLANYQSPHEYSIERSLLDLETATDFTSKTSNILHISQYCFFSNQIIARHKDSRALRYNATYSQIAIRYTVTF